MMMILVIGISAPVHAASSYFVTSQSGLSLNSASANLGLEAGLRTSNYGIFAKADWNPWFSAQDLNDSLKAGVLNLGVGIEHLYFEERCRITLTAGTSTLLFDTALDDAMTTGFFIELAPVSLRWKLSEELTLQIEPTTISLAMPVVTGIPLVTFQYRHSVSLEWVLK